MTTSPPDTTAHPPGALARYGVVVLGGIVGTLLRHGQGALFGALVPGSFPWGTFTINVGGSVALCAFLAAVMETVGAHPLWRPFFAIGFCGGYTTFSSFENEAHALARKGRYDVAIAYVVASVAVSFAAAFLSARLVRQVRRGRGRLLLAPPLLLAPAITFAITSGVVLSIGELGRREMEPLALGCVAVAIGGPLGATARYGLGGWISARVGTFFPWGTFVINLTGSFLIGLFESVASRIDGGAPPFARLFLATGILGGYTTFSSFTYETLSLLEEDGRKRAALNVLGSVLGGFAAVVLGFWVGERIGGSP